jgi:Epoxide hydrolase N terminus
MVTTVQATTNIRPFRVDIPDEKLADLRRRIAATRWPRRGTRHRFVSGCAVEDSAEAGALLGERARLAQGREEAHVDLSDLGFRRIIVMLPSAYGQNVIMVTMDDG